MEHVLQPPKTLGAPVMRRWILVCLFVTIAYGSSGALTLADDILPPPWTRGDPRTTYQDWTFGTDANPVTPDVGIANPYGIPVATITNGSWAQYFDNHVGVWDLGSNSSIDIVIPNAPDEPQWNKQLWTQMTWQGDLPSFMVEGVAGQLVETDVLPGTNWSHSTWLTILPNNPPRETMHITGTTHLGEVVVDTQCVPEPSVLALLAMGACSLAAFVWRRRS
jgi:hypothetical protein